MTVRLAWRSIWRNRRRTLITVCSIGLGLAFNIFFISLGEGVYHQLVEQIVRMQAGHITLENPEYREAPAIDLFINDIEKVRGKLEAWPQVEKTKKLILGQGIAKSGAGNVAAALMGVEPSIEAATSPLVRNLVDGEYLADDDEALVVIGDEMARRLNLDVGKKLVITSNDVNGDLVEELCRVKGVFETGSEELDTYFVQMPIGFAAKLFNIPDDSATQLGVILKNADSQNGVLTKIRAQVADRTVSALPWQSILPEVASYIKMDRTSNFVFQAILIFLVLFTIFNTILMSVMERQKEFAVLLSIGTRTGSLKRQVFMETVFLALIGCSIGVIIGGIASGLVQYYGIDLGAFLDEGVSISGFAITTKLHSRVTVQLLGTTAGLVFLATLLLSLIPMKRSARIDIVEQLR